MIKKERKMKTNLLLMLFLTVGWTSLAQDNTDWGSDSLKCRQCISLYNEPLQQGNINEAVIHWRCAMEICPKYGKSLYINGIYLYDKIYSETTVETRKEELADTIIMLYEKATELFETDINWQADYGSNLVKYKSKEYKKAYDVLKPVIDEVTSPDSYTPVYSFYKTLYNCFRKEKDAEKKKIYRSELIDYYAISMERLEAVLKNGGNAQGVGQVQGYIEKIFVKVAENCEDITPIIDDKITNLPDDKEKQIKEIQKLMSVLEKTECQSTDTYGKLLDRLLEINPSADAAFRAGEYYRSNKNNSKAYENYKKAIELEGDGENADKYKFGLVKAYYDASSYKSVVGAAKAVGGEYKGEALKYAGLAIASLANSCGDTYFERKSNYCLAVEYLEKASAAGASGTGSYISKYKASFPTKTEAFNADNKKEGDSIYLPCWGENTNLRLSD
jgi:Tfp pilus assembly protein PilF